MSAVPFAAAIANITTLKEIDAPRLFRELGTSLTEGLVDLARSHDLTLVASGEPALFYLRLADDDSLMLHQRWIAECVKRGVFLSSHHNHFINAALTPEDIARTLDIADQAFRALGTPAAGR
jgi:glutamate-1-semialdehyde 2,1-aminomutase